MVNAQLFKPVAGAICAIALVFGIRHVAGSSSSASSLLGGGGRGGDSLATAVNQSVECLNGVDKTYLLVAERYLDSLRGQSPGPKIPSIDSVNPTRCLDGLTSASGAPEDLEQAMIAYRAAVSTLAPVVEATHAYYEQKDYKDDAFAKGRELHTQLVAAFEEHGRASERLRRVIDKVQKEGRAANLEALAANGKTMSFYIAQLMNSAQDLVDLVNADQLDTTATLAAATTAIGAYDELKAYEAKTTKEEIEKATFFSFSSSEFDLLAVQIKELSRALRDGKKLPESTNRRAPDGSSAKLLDAYNAAVSSANRYTR
ncbi:MAG: DUF3829 domain-containing protein [Kofleriaceae bacterium]